MKGEQIGEVREELKTKAEPNAWKALLQAGGQGSGSSSTRRDSGHGAILSRRGCGPVVKRGQYSTETYV